MTPPNLEDPNSSELLHGVFLKDAVVEPLISTLECVRLIEFEIPQNLPCPTEKSSSCEDFLVDFLEISKNRPESPLRLGLRSMTHSGIPDPDRTDPKPRFRSRKTPSRIGVGLVTSIVLGCGFWHFLGSTMIPARTTLSTGGKTWKEYENPSNASRPPGLIWPAAFSPDGSLLATISRQGVLSFWDQSTGRNREIETALGDRKVYGGVFSLESRTFAAISTRDGFASFTIDLIDIASCAVRSSTATAGGGLLQGSLAFADEGKTIGVAAYQAENLVLVDCDTATGQLISTRILSAVTTKFRFQVSSHEKRLGLTQLPDQPSGALACNWALWDLEKNLELGRFLGRAAVTAVDLTPDGKVFAIGREGGSVEIWELEPQRLRTVLNPHDDSTDSSFLQVASDGSSVASVGDYRREAGPLALFRRRIASIVHDSSDLAPVELVVVKAATGEILVRTNDECRPLFSPDGHRLATLHRDGTIRIRDIPKQ